MPKTICVPKMKLWDESREQFISIPETTFKIEHSLVSISKWEAIWKKQFLNKEHSSKELVSYIECMCITQNIPSYLFSCLPQAAIREITEYISDPMSATTITPMPARGPKGAPPPPPTSEVLYFYMFSYNIPKECEKWHINRLIKLIEVFNEMNKPNQKMGANDTAKLYRDLNNQRRAKLHTKG